MVLLVIRRSPLFEIPPPDPVSEFEMPVATAELPLIVQFLIVIEPKLQTPPPNAEAGVGKRGSELSAEHVLPLMVELVIINEPESFNIPPPLEVTVKPY